MKLNGINSLKRIHAILGLTLVVSGGITFYASAIAPQEDDLAALSLMVTSELNFFGGLWLLWGEYAEETRPWTVAVFTGLWISSLFQALTGKCTCGCFGSFVVSPWFTVIFDLAALVVLLKWRLSEDEAESFPASLPLSLGLGLTAILIVVANFWRQPLVASAGTATFNGRPLQDVPLVFVRNGIEFQVRTNRDGFFRLPPVRPGMYTVSVSGSLPAPEPESDSRISNPRPLRQTKVKNARGKSPDQSADLARSYSYDAKIRRLIDDCAQEDLKVDF